MNEKKYNDLLELAEEFSYKYNEIIDKYEDRFDKEDILMSLDNKQGFDWLISEDFEIQKKMLKMSITCNDMLHNKGTFDMFSERELEHIMLHAATELDERENKSYKGNMMSKICELLDS